VFATCKFLRNERAQKAIIRKLIEPCRPLPVRVTPEEARNTNCRHWAPRKQFGSLSNGSSFRSTLSLEPAAPRSACPFRRKFPPIRRPLKPSPTHFRFAPPHILLSQSTPPLPSSPPLRRRRLRAIMSRREKPAGESPPPSPEPR
jgi:hypothetical protein